MEQRSFYLLFIVFFLWTLTLSAFSLEVSKLQGWQSTGQRPKQDEVVDFKIALKQRNLKLLENIVWEISDPDSPKYTQYLSPQQLTDIIAPSQSEIEYVLTWLQSFDSFGAIVHRLSINRDYILVSAPVHLVEKMFETESFLYNHPKSKKSIIRSEKVYKIPQTLQHIIELVDGLCNFPPMRNTKLHSVGESGQKITPLVIKKLYNLTATASSSTKSKQAVAEFEQAYFYPSDLPIFEERFHLPNQSVERIVGKNDPDTGYLGEATLDVEYIIGVGTGIPTWVFSISTLGLDLITWALNVTGTPGSPKVHSISWGSGESGYDPSHMNRINVEFQKMAAQGYSILIASGDEGTGHTGFWCGTFDPTFPASSPFVTAVGGTYLEEGTTTHEIGWSNSGGGFSTVFARPPYQTEAVESYLKQGGLPSSGYFNASGRGFPDVSCLSTNFQVCTEKSWGELSGTSASTPTFAAFISLINDIRLQNGKRELGFLNPLLYKLKNGVGKDITEGINTSGECPKGFKATKGWDAITGLGTPQWPVLLEQLA